MVFEVETLQTDSYLARHRVDAPSLQAALEQIRDGVAEDLQRTRIEDGETVLGIEYVYFSRPVTIYGGLVKTDAQAASVVEIDLQAFVKEIAAALRECGDNEVIDIRVGWVPAQTLFTCNQAMREDQMNTLSDEDQTVLIQRLDTRHRDQVCSFSRVDQEDRGLLREG